MEGVGSLQGSKKCIRRSLKSVYEGLHFICIVGGRWNAYKETKSTSGGHLHLFMKGSILFASWEGVGMLTRKQKVRQEVTYICL